MLLTTSQAVRHAGLGYSNDADLLQFPPSSAKKEPTGLLAGTQRLTASACLHERVLPVGVRRPHAGIHRRHIHPRGTQLPLGAGHIKPASRHGARRSKACRQYEDFSGETPAASLRSSQAAAAGVVS